MKHSIILFLRRYAKPIMVTYYMKFQIKDMLKVLDLLYKYKSIKEGINITLICSIIESETGWEKNKVIDTVGKCIYCNLIRFAGSK